MDAGTIPRTGVLRYIRDNTGDVTRATHLPADSLSAEYGRPAAGSPVKLRRTRAAAIAGIQDFAMTERALVERPHHGKPVDATRWSMVEGAVTVEEDNAEA